MAFKDGDRVAFVRFQCNGVKIFRLSKERTVSIDKWRLHLNSVIGMYPGELIMIQNESAQRISSLQEVLDKKQDQPCGDDNRNINCVGSNQKLSHGEIESMKAELDGPEMIAKLVENNCTFNQKTVFSQEKYVKKKQKKYLPLYRLERVTTRILFNLFNNDVQGILFLRPDTLALMLTCANVHYGSRVIVIDSCKGLLLMSVLERLGGRGLILNVNENFKSSYCSLNFSNFSKEKLRIIHDCTFETMHKFKKRSVSEDVQRAEENEVKTSHELPINEDKNGLCTELSTKSMSDGVQHTGTLSNCTPLCSNDSSGDKVANDTLVGNVLKRKTESEDNQDVDIEALKEPFDSLMIVSKFNLISLLRNLVGFIKPGGKFVIYHQSREILVQSFLYLKKEGVALNMDLSHNWYREYQIMEKRTHPMVEMNAASGYLLSGTIVSNRIVE